MMKRIKSVWGHLGWRTTLALMMAAVLGAGLSWIWPPTLLSSAELHSNLQLASVPERMNQKHLDVEERSAGSHLTQREERLVRALAGTAPVLKTYLDSEQAGERIVFLSSSLATDPGMPESRLVHNLYYEYSTNSTIQVDVDLTARKVTAVTRNHDLVPPLSAEEISRAFGIIVDSEKTATVRAEFEELTGDELTEESDVYVNANSYRPSASYPGPESCETDRCAIAMIQVTGGKFLTTGDFVVNLSTGKVEPL